MSALASPVLPDDKPIGHNSNGDPAAIREGFMENVTAFLKGADVWATRETFDADTVTRANDIVTGAKQLRKKADEARKVEKTPHTDKAKEVDTYWASVDTTIEKVVATVTPKIQAHLAAKKAEADAEAARLREVEQQKAREAEAARQSAAHATTESARIIAEAEADRLDKETRATARQANRAEKPVQVASATGLGRTVSMRKEWSIEIVDRKKAIVAMMLMQPDVFDDLIDTIARGALRSAPSVGDVKQVPEIAGIKFSYKDVFK